MPKINQEEYKILKEIRKDGFEEIRRNSTGDIAVRSVGEKTSSHQYETKHNDKFKFLEATGDYWSIAELIEEYEYSALERHVNSFKELSKAIRTKESEETEVKKDIEWAIKEAKETINGFFDRSSRGVAQHYEDELIASIADIINQLDEPEVPKQEEVNQAYKDGYEKGKQHTFYKGYLEGLADKEKEPETVADVVSTFWKSFERLKEVMSMKVEESEE